MKNEILEELWKVKDQVANECGYDIEKLAKKLRTKEKEGAATVVDLTLQAKSATNKS